MSHVKVYQLDSEGLPVRRTADFAIGHPSQYGRKHSPAVTTRSAGSRFSAFAYDNVNHRVFVSDGVVNAWGPSGRMLVFDAHPDRMENGPEALAVFGQPDFTSTMTGGVGPHQTESIRGRAWDEKNQRLFASDGGNNRVLVWDVAPDRLTETPEPTLVIGQTDLLSKTPGAGPSQLNRPGNLSYDDANDRLFVVDSGNNRILVFDASPQQLTTAAEAMVVIGQADFGGREGGIGPNRLNRPGSVVYDSVYQRLFVSDGGNNRILVFDVAADRLQSGSAASHVLGQDDFSSSGPRASMKKAVSGSMEFDSVRQRIYMNDGDGATSGGRHLVFDVHPDRIRNNPDAMAVLFQESFDTYEMATSRTQAMPKDPFINEETGMLYVAGSHAGGNRVAILDVSGDLPAVGMPATDVLGHFDDDGKVDFTGSEANGRASGRSIYPRSVALDPVDHRLFVGDQYLHRVLVFQLDEQNRILDRTAAVILGQPTAYTGSLREPSSRTMKNPLAVAYDELTKRLFVGDSWHQRILVFDAHPERLETFAEAIMVLGQQDFETVEPGTSATKITFSKTGNVGMTSTQPSPLAMEIVQEGRRLFVSDGGNHRVLVFDIAEGELRIGAAAINVIGQPDFEGDQRTPADAPVRGGGEQGAGGRGRGVTDGKGFDTPSGLAYDPNHDRLFVADGNNSRVLVFDATKGNLRNGPQAIAVLGQKDFTSGDEVRLDVESVSEDVARRRMRMPNGLAYDTANDRLYAGDKGNDRVLIFEAAPDELQSGMAAVGVIGQRDFVTRSAGGGEQEDLLDPRGIEFDSDHQRLFVTDSFWAKLPVFDIPQSERTVKLDARSMTNYSTLDAWNGRGMPELDQKKDWQAKLTAEVGQAPGGLLVYTKTEQFLNPMSERRSRILISETSIMAPEPLRQALYYLDEGRGKSHSVVVNNPNGEPAEVRLTFQDEVRTLEETRTVVAGAQLEVVTSEMFGPSIVGRVGTLRIESVQPVSSVVLRRTRTARGEELLLAMPQVVPLELEDAVIAGVKSGGGYETELVLVNPHSRSVEGRIEVLEARTGQPVAWQSGEDLTYDIPSGGVLRRQLRSTSSLPEETYAVVRPRPGTSLPWAAAVTGIRNNSLLLSQTVTPTRPKTQMAWIPVDTLSSAIRHGETPSQMLFAVANSSRTPALMRFTLFDTGGDEKGRYEQLVEPHQQRVWSLADLFNMQQFKGTVRIWSDVPVSLSNKRITASVRGEPVESEVGYLEPDSMTGKQEVILPGITDGAGVSTEIVLINPTDGAVEASMKIRTPDGLPSEIVLR